MAEKNLLYLLGTSMDITQMPPSSMELIESADILSGNQLLLEVFPHLKSRYFPRSAPLRQWLQELKQKHDEGYKVVIISTGDPSYFGISKFVLEIFPKDEIVIIPSPTIVQTAFARLKVSWQNAEIVNLHAQKDHTKFWTALFRAAHYRSGYLAVYTDEANPPGTVAKRLLARSHQDWQMIIFENLNTPEEKISTWSPTEAKIRRFSARNLLVLRCLKKPASITFGMSEEEYYHRPGLISSREVRSVALGLLELKSHHIMWDICSGSGAMAIEAASITIDGAVWAVEKSPAHSEHIANNRAKFGAFHVEVIEDDATQAMIHLPPPDRIFIGGGGKHLESIVKQAKNKLKSGGIIVVRLSKINRIEKTAKLLMNAGMEVSITQVQSSRSKNYKDKFNLQPLSQVWLIRGVDKNLDMTHISKK